MAAEEQTAETLVSVNWKRKQSYEEMQYLGNTRKRDLLGLGSKKEDRFTKIKQDYIRVRAPPRMPHFVIVWRISCV